MARPRLLDLFCGAGGAAMGYHRAGFEVVGVDIKPQPHYPFEFHQADAMTFPLDGYDAIHASPPCQKFSSVTRMAGTSDRHFDLLTPTRDRLVERGGAWAIENVLRAPFGWSLILCGWAFGMPLHRHRQFELPWLALTDRWCPGPQPQGVSLNPYDKQNRAANGLSGSTDPRYALAMGIDWMSGQEISEAIPPAYTEHIGRQLIQAIGGTDANPQRDASEAIPLDPSSIEC